MLQQRQLEFAAEDAGVRSGGARWPAARLLFVCSALSLSSGTALEGESVRDSVVQSGQRL